MSSAGVRVGVGTRFRYDGETVEVIEMAITATGNEVVLKDHHGRVMRLAVKELLQSVRAQVIPDSPGPSSDDDEDLASVVLAQLSHGQRDALLERAAHIREVLTGYRSGSPEMAEEGEPRPQYAPDRPLYERYADKAAELGVGFRTIQRWVQGFQRKGEAGLVGGDQLSRRQAPKVDGTGQVMTLARTFPIRLAPLPGEALDSWLEALAHRLDARLGDVLGDLGLAAPVNNGIRELAVPTDWTIALREEEAARIAHATGADPQQLHDMTLMRFDGRALRIDQDKRKVSRHFLWERPRGSRFCPECLAGSGGRWPLTWRLGWSFACLTHHQLLADRCPACGRVQRERPFSRNALPIPGRCGTCPSRAGDLAIPAGCGQDLTRAETLSLPVGHPALAAQRLVLETIESGNAGFGPYAPLPQPAMAALSDLRAVAGRILADLPADDLPRWVPQDLAGAHLSADPDGETHRRALARPAFMAPARAASVAVAVTAAFRVLGQPEIQRARIVMRELVEAIREELWQVSTTSIGSWGRGISPVLRGVYLAALAPSLRPSDRLRHRTTSSLPTLPAAERAQTNRRRARYRHPSGPLGPSGSARPTVPIPAPWHRPCPAPCCSSATGWISTRSPPDSARPPTAGPSPASCNSSPAIPAGRPSRLR